ncbi:hypothetical protein [Tardiphaga sp. P9-11]|uniref:hypothetical protein n=1 Tax=Tardiphaga sp. P9-11 TaxID=2024614 RepID=UPI0011F26E6E|nr:hypothetical protein [Tardiphaga sp. P9-11]
MSRVQPRTLSILAVLALFGAGILFLGSRDFSGGVDAGIHYAIAEQINQYGAWPLPKSSFLGAIAHYPPAAHILGIVAGALVGSTLKGLFFVAAGAFLLIYLVAADLMKRDSPVETIATLLVFTVLAVIFRKYRFIVGNEVVANFFYAQLAGTAALMAGFYAAYQLSSLSFGWWLVLCAIISHLISWFFPLNAVQFALAASVLRGAPLVDPRENTKRRIFETLVTAGLAGAVAVVHPAMIDMAAISSNDGGITISDGVMLYIVIGAIVLLPTFYLKMREPTSLRANAILSLGIGVSMPCLLLCALFYVGGFGSLYAVKKSGFLLGTLECLLLSTLVVQWIFTKFPAKGRTRSFSPAATAASSSLFLAAAIAFVFAGRPSEAVSSLASYDRDVRQLLSQEVSRTFDGITVSMNSTISPHANYLIGYALLRPTSSALAAQHGLFLSAQPNLGSAKFVLGSEIDGKTYASRCLIQNSDRLAIILSECASKGR